MKHLTLRLKRRTLRQIGVAAKVLGMTRTGFLESAVVILFDAANRDDAGQLSDLADLLTIFREPRPRPRRPQAVRCRRGRG